jgi:prolyl-tRNA editing enzyme YbaK/EbsC (Cys-tRNA(Pro) deacylase)
VATRDEVLAATGFEVGGVAPCPAPRLARVLIERELLQHETVWVGAGSPRHMLEIAPPDLARLTSAEAADLAEA